MELQLSIFKNNFKTVWYNSQLYLNVLGKIIIIKKKYIENFKFFRNFYYNNYLK